MNNSSLRFLLVTLVVLLLSGCATNPDKIGASYVSPLMYKSFTDEQVIMEMNHVGRRTSELYAQLKKEAKADKWQMGIGLLIFWPTLFALEGGDGVEAQEYARLKGEYEALRQSAVSRSISITDLPPSPEAIVKEAEEKAKKEAKKTK